MTKNCIPTKPHSRMVPNLKQKAQQNNHLTQTTASLQINDVEPFLLCGGLSGILSEVARFLVNRQSSAKFVEN